MRLVPKETQVCRVRRGPRGLLERLVFQVPRARRVQREKRAFPALLVQQGRLVRQAYRVPLVLPDRKVKPAFRDQPERRVLRARQVCLVRKELLD